MEVSASVAGKHAAIPMRDDAGREVLVCILKYTFVVGIDGRAVIDGDGPSPHLVDVPFFEDATSSIRRHSDLYPSKPGTDVLLTASATPRPGSRAAHADVTLRVGPVDKTIRAFGARVWQSGLSGIKPGPAQPLVAPLPIVWEHAYGGLDLSDPQRPAGHDFNTLGRGCVREPGTLVGKAASQLELAGKGFDTPAGFGPTHRHWEPRRSRAGTFDDEWQKTRLPIMPLDFDPRFHCFAPPDQHVAAGLRGDEPVEIHGATPEGLWRFHLPRVTPGVRSLRDGKRYEHRCALDTFHIDADLGRVEVTFRAQVPLPTKWQRLEKVFLFEKEIVAWQRDASAGVSS